MQWNFFFFLQEVFVQDLALMSHKLSPDPKNIEYNILADIVNEDETMAFLQGGIEMKSFIFNCIVLWSICRAWFRVTVYAGPRWTCHYSVVL